MRHRTAARLTPWNPGSTSDFDEGAAPAVPPNEVFASVLDKVQHDFVNTPGAGRITNARLSDGALTGMLSSLHDPHTSYLTPAQCALRTNAILGNRQGIGAELGIVSSNVPKSGEDIDHRYLAVQSVAPGGPAERAGLIPGDRITEIDGHWVIPYTVAGAAESGYTAMLAHRSDASQQSAGSGILPGITAARAIEMLTSGTGKTLQLTVERRNHNAEDHIDVTTANTSILPVEHTTIGRGFTYLRVNAFNESASGLIDAVLRRHQDWAAGLIIDLRQNPGGVEAEPGSHIDGFRCALNLISYIARKSVVGMIERRPGEQRPLRAPGTRPPDDGGAHVAVLIDSGTSNIAEMAAAGLRDAGGAMLVGSTTAGDNVVTAFTPLKSGGALEIAVAHLFTASGSDISSGVRPDYSVEAHGLGKSHDAALRRARKLIGV